MTGPMTGPMTSAVTDRRRTLVALGCLVVLVIAMALGTPRGGGPDESAHMVRAGALVRGDVRGTPVSPDSPYRSFDAPGWLGQPDASCYALVPTQPASCAAVTEPAGRPISSAGSYPVAAHVLPGLATLLPGETATWWFARLAHAVVPLVLVGAALARLLADRRTLAASALLLALTPGVLFTFAVVNPSGIAIAGGIAVWVFADLLLSTTPTHPGDPHVSAAHHASHGRGMTDTGERDSGGRWLVAGWAALILPRNDGVVWALLLLAVLWVLHPRAPLELWARCSRAQRAVAAGSTAVAGAWAVLVGSDLVPIPGGGTGTTLLTNVVGRTGENLREAVGVLGWLDTPIPETAQLLWWLGLGLLVAPLVLRGRSRRLQAVGAVAVAVVVVPWVLEFVQGRTAGLFWQGRYSLPLFVGAVLIAGADRDLDEARAARLARAVAAVAAVVWSLAYLQLLRRFGVGIVGSMAPWRWDTWSAPVPPVVLAPVFVAAAVTLRAAVTRAWPLGEVATQSERQVEQREEQRA